MQTLSVLGTFFTLESRNMHKGIKSIGTFFCVVALCLPGNAVYAIDTLYNLPSKSYSYLTAGGIISEDSHIIFDKSDFNLYLIVLLLTTICLLFFLWYRSYTTTVEMKKLNAELETYIDSNIKLAQFAHIASHDLKSPLRTVKSFAGLLEKKITNESEEVTECIRYIQNGADQMEALTTDLLDFAKVNSMDVKHVRCNTNELVKNVTDMLDYEIKNTNAQVIMSNMPEFIMADKNKIQRVFHNLLSNSLRFTNPDHDPSIEITCRQQGDNFIFSVIDNGIGIEQDYLKDVFQAFSKLNSSATHKGSGMGLAIAKIIIELHCGKIWAKSQVNLGSEFSFSLPKKGEEISYDAKKVLLAYQS